METKNLSYNVTKFYVENGITYKMNVRISLDDYGKNGICDWSITADIYEKRRNGRFVWYASGCCHDEILKYFPEFKTFIDLHLCNHYGQPMYPVENGFYHLKNSDKGKTMDYLRITETKYNIIADTVQQYINDNGLDNELYDIVCEWLAENSHIEPNFLDYSETDLNEYLQKNGYLEQ